MEELTPKKIENIILANLDLHNDDSISGIDVIAKTFYDLLLPLQKQKENDGWINVEDEVPELNQEYDAIVHGRRITDCKGFIGTGWTKKQIKESMQIRGCTYWKPIPTLPK
jgi:hypothetical protein